MSYANAWSRWFDVIEAGAAPLSARMLVLGAVGGAVEETDGEAASVLDIGTGLGEPAVTAARALGPRGRVTAIDSDPRMIAFARERAAREGVDRIDFRVGDAESLDLPDGAFDVILARWSLMFVEDKPRLLHRLTHSLRPGGRIVAALWREPERVPALTLAERSVYEHFGWPLSERPNRKAFSLSDEDETVDLFRTAGYEHVAAETCAVVYHFESPQAYIQYRLDVADPLCAAVEDRPDASWAEAYDAIERALQPFETEGGGCRLVNDAYCVVARR